MKTYKLNNGVLIPSVGFGTYKLTDPQTCEDSIMSALKAGYRMIDTAQAYGNESYIGSAIKKSNISRAELFIITKVWFTNHGEGITYRSVMKSMKNLGLDYLDMVLIHWPLGDYYSAWRDLEKLYFEGKVKSIGVSNFEADRLVDLIIFNRVTPVINQVEANIFCQQKNNCEWMKKYGVQPMAYSPLGQGKINDIYNLPEVKLIASKYKKTSAQIMLRFLIQNDFIIIPRSMKKEHIIENIDVFDFTLTQDEIGLLKSIDKAKPIIGRSADPNNIESSTNWLKKHK